MKIKTLRQARGISQQAFANQLGVDRSTVTKWETGRAEPRCAIVPRIAEALHCSIDELYETENAAPEGG